MKKAERLLDLIAFLLNARDPVSFDEIQSAFDEDYAEGTEEAIARKFERDKADIIALGLPLVLKIGDQVDKEGYTIDRDSYSLPELSLAPDEQALLFLVGTAALDMDASPFSRDLVLALNKLSFASTNEEREATRTARNMINSRPVLGAGIRKREHLDSLRKAIADQKTVTLTYHGFYKNEITQRKVDPYGMAYRRGTWILVGRCHLRDAIRVFHVDRLRALAVNPHKPKTHDFEFPESFQLREHVTAEPWQIKVHEPMQVVLRFEAPVAESAAAEFAHAATQIEADGQARVVHLEATHLDGLLPRLLWFRDKAKVLAPERLVEITREALSTLAGENAP